MRQPEAPGCSYLMSRTVFTAPHDSHCRPDSTVQRWHSRIPHRVHWPNIRVTVLQPGQAIAFKKTSSIFLVFALPEFGVIH